MEVLSTNFDRNTYRRYNTDITPTERNKYEDAVRCIAVLLHNNRVHPGFALTEADVCGLC